MTSAAILVDFARAPYDIRPAFEETHAAYWERLARPGAWWTGEKRVAIAAEVRSAWDCRLCAERREALSPQAVEGSHDVAGSVLPDTAVDAVHRLVTDANRVSKPWIEGL